MQHPHSGYSEHSPVRAPFDHAPIDHAPIHRKAQKGAIVLVIAGGDAAQRAEAATAKPNAGFDLDQVLVRE
jgi:hypothetical protein